MRAAALAGDAATAGRLCELYHDPRYAVHSHGGRTYGGVFFDIRGASYIVSVAEPEGCSLGAYPWIITVYYTLAHPRAGV